ncbi:hypothetical protein PENTCL1PPCAC_27228, partial [Pristionchus entomophagus]
VMALKDIDYFFCFFCQSMQFNVKQGLGHFANNTHIGNMGEGEDESGRDRGMGHLFVAYTTTTLQLVTTLPNELHDTETTQFTAPLIMSGMRAPAPHDDFRPSMAFLNIMKMKYEDKINGNIDGDKL